MAYNFFSLTREHQTELARYDDGKFSIEVVGTKYGIANIWDKEILIYLESLLQERLDAGEKPSPIFQFTANDLFRITGTKAAGTAYERLEEGLKRLKGTMVTTNLLDDDGGGGETEAFGWIDDYKIRWRTNKSGEKTMHGVRVILGRRLYNAILKKNQVLTYDSRYFQLPPMEKRLYEIARCHVGDQPGFKMGIEKLRLRVGLTIPLRHFKSRLLAISKRKNPLPGFGISLVDPRIKRALDHKRPKPQGRTPLHSYLVYFFPDNKLNRLAPIDAVPSLEDLGDDL
jgi:plasmid replication initiation protein